MIWNNYSHLRGKHAFLSASKHHWVNYSDEKLVEAFLRSDATTRGTRIHEIASELIEMGIKLPRTNKTLDRYVNDAIGYRMTPEKILYYSDNCFGTADAISFKNNLLRIHDLKTGVTPVNVRQLEIYASMFCLEYSVNPNDIDMELRIYQNDEVMIHFPEKVDILNIMDKIVTFDKRLTSLQLEVK